MASELVARRGTGRRSRRSVRRLVPPLFMLGAVGCGVVLNAESGARLMLAVGVAGAMILCGLVAPKRLVLMTLAWLVVMGVARRILSGVLPQPAGGDPLLLIGPFAVFSLAVLSPVLGKRWSRTRLTDSVLLVTIIFGVSVFNPRQGGLIVGLGGVLLVIIPMIGFWVGRSFLDDRTFRTMLKVIAGGAAFAAAYGLVQTFIRFPSWDQRWIRESGYEALEVGGFTRPFATFPSVNEYATFLAIGLAAWLTVGFTSKRWHPPRAGAIVIIGAAMWLVSVRAVIVLAVIALGASMAARRGMSAARAALAAVLLILALPWVVGQVVSPPQGRSIQDRFIAHQVSGLTDPFGDESTLPIHLKQVTDGVRSAATDPAGTGVGAVTIAAQRFGGRSAGTENDPGDAAIIAGFPGLASYLLVVSLGFRRVYRLAVTRRDDLALAALAILIITFLHWLSGGQYAVALIAWLTLGWADRAEDQWDTARKLT